MLRLIDDLLQKELKPETWDWLSTMVAKIQIKDAQNDFITAFTAMPRHTGKEVVYLNRDEKLGLKSIQPLVSFDSYTIDRYARVWLILNFPSVDKSNYLKAISQLFKAAEMNELVALYGALPFFNYPQEWVKQCTEGIRSNIGTVLEAIMYENPFASKFLCEAEWNQLILKAFFTEKDVSRIVGLDDRANKELAYILSDYAHERWAAGRKVNPQLWRLTAKFIDERIFADIEKVFKSGDPIEKTAAAMACFQSQYMPSQDLLESESELKSAIETGKINWNSIAKNLK
ncbi:MAG: EboA domain-containing protein [Flavobacterium sp.]|nr:EboA domain-containing protein [Pedobacter sp.]